MLGGGSGMGGGAGGGMLRTVSRAVTRTGVTGASRSEPLSSSANSNTNSPNSSTATSSRHTQKKPTSPCYNQLRISSTGSPFSPHNPPTPGIPIWDSGYGSSVASYCDESEWISVGGSEDEFFLGPVPSLDEVHDAVSALQQGFDAASYSQLVKDKYAYSFDKDGDQISSPTSKIHSVSSIGSELDWMEPSLHLCNSRALQTQGYNRVYEAFHLLQTEPLVQKMVVSLSSDQAVWNAILNNNIVKQLRDSYSAAEESDNDSECVSEEGSSDDIGSATNFVAWIFENTKAKLKDVFEKISQLVNEFFKPPNDPESTDPFDEKLRTSLMLTVMVLLVVVVTRGATRV